MRKVILLFLSVFSFFIASAQNPSVTISLKEKPILEFFKQVEKQSNYNFVYSNEVVSDTLTISVNVSSTPLFEVLKKVLQKKNLQFKIVSNNLIVVSRADKETEVEKQLYSFYAIVKDVKQNVLPLVTLNLFEDGEQVAKSIGNNLGEIRISYAIDKEKNYQIKISSVGYKELAINLENTLLPENNLGVLVLESKTNQLKEINVVGNQPILSVDGGNIIFNVSENISAQGTNALEILSRVPGVFVANDNSISLNGKAGVTILLDGKQTYLSGKEIADLLKTVSSSNVKSIEIINTPGAKYDAAGTAGIINVKTIKTLGRGFNTSIFTGLNYGVTIKNNQDLSFSLRNNKLNVYGGYSHFIGNYSYLYGSDRIQMDKFYNSFTDDVDKRNRLNSRLGADFSINSKNTIGILVNGNFVIGGGITDTKTDIGHINNLKVEETLDAVNDYYYQKTQRYNFNVNYKYEDTLGKMFSVDADYGTFKKGNGNMQSNTYTNISNMVLSDNLYRSLNEINVNLKAVKFDYATPLLKGKFESGVKFSSVETDNDTKFFEVLPAGEFIDDNKSNHFIYRENILAGYINYKKDIKKWQFQAGLRVERTSSEGKLQNSFSQLNAGNIERDYYNFFPFFSISYKSKAAYNWFLSYSKRIDRPAYQNLNPFVYLLDELSFWRGNPFLQPQISNKAMLQMVYKSNTIASFTYTHTADFSVEITDTIDRVKIVMTPQNLGTQQHFSFNFIQNFDPYKWWKVSFNSNIYHIYNDISFSGNRNLSLNQTAYRLNLFQTYQLPYKLKLELTNTFNSKRLVSANKIAKANSQMDIGLQRSLFENKAYLRFSVSDIYKGAKGNTLQINEGLYLHNYSYYETRQFKLNFSYKFSSGANKDPRNRTSALENENNRIK
jgi:hypothetical protein